MSEGSRQLHRVSLKTDIYRLEMIFGNAGTGVPSSSARCQSEIECSNPR